MRSAIVNPARLTPDLRDDICDGCDLQPSVAIPFMRRFGSPDYAVRPGVALSAVRVSVDIIDAGQAADDRFEINHHPYRLRQSACFLASGRALNCMTCHDPHRKVPAPERAAHYRAACETCHEGIAHAAPAMADFLVRKPAFVAVDAADCAGCHMPRRRTQDVVHVVMTDHRIVREPTGDERLAPLSERTPDLSDVLVGLAADDPEAGLTDMYRAAAVIRAGSRSPDAVEALSLALAVTRPDSIDPYLDLVQGLLQAQRFEDAEATLRALQGRTADLQVDDWLGLALVGLGRHEEAAVVLRDVLVRQPSRPETGFNLALALFARGRDQAALEQLDATLALRPNLVAAWFYRGASLRRLGKAEEAAASFVRALEVDPAHTRSYIALGELLLELGRHDEGLRYLRHGTRAAADGRAVQQALDRLQSSVPLQ